MADDNALGGGDVSSDAAAWSSILAHIRSGEGTLRNPWLLYGGKAFVPGTSHPGIEQLGPTGRPTSAAGPYQWQRATWDEQAKKLGLTNFADMGQQNAAAADLAATAYAKNTGGRDILSDFKSGTIDWHALSSEWTSLAEMKAGSALGSAVGGEHPGSIAAPFVPPVVAFGGGDNQATPAVSSAAAAPAASAAISPLLALALAMPHFSFTPVKYNPFAGQTTMQGTAVPSAASGAPRVPLRSTPGAAGVATAALPGNIVPASSSVVVPSPLHSTAPDASNFLLGPLLHPQE